MAALAVEERDGMALQLEPEALMAQMVVMVLQRAVQEQRHLQFHGQQKICMVDMLAAEAVMVALEQHPAALLAELVVLAAVEEVLTPAPAVITEVKVKLILVEAAAEKVHMGLIRAAAALF